MATHSGLPLSLVAEACEAFISNPKGTAAEIAKDLTAAWSKRGIDQVVTREGLYDILRIGKQHGLFHVKYPLAEKSEQRLSDRFSIPRKSLRVVDTESDKIDHVAVEAAAVVTELILELAKSRGADEPIHIGFGAGWTTRSVAYEVSRRLPSEDRVPPLWLHAMSTGCVLEQELTAPVFFFGFFERVAPKIHHVGMFGPPYAEVDGYEDVKARPGIKDALAQRGKIDIMVTALAAASDPDADLRRVVAPVQRRGQPAALKALLRKGWKGDVQRLPYSSDGDLTSELQNRPVTLFENFKELVEHVAKPDRSCVLVSGPCTQCGGTRAEALLPLLTTPELRAFTHLVTDVPTTRAVLDMVAP